MKKLSFRTKHFKIKSRILIGPKLELTLINVNLFRSLPWYFHDIFLITFLRVILAY